jgi:hypothetical protein
MYYDIMIATAGQSTPRSSSFWDWLTLQLHSFLAQTIACHHSKNTQQTIDQEPPDAVMEHLSICFSLFVRVQDKWLLP